MEDCIDLKKNPCGKCLFGLFDIISDYQKLSTQSIQSIKLTAASFLTAMLYLGASVCGS
jgi:hypothetical protein